MPFLPKFNITNNITAALVKIERTRGFLEAARLSDEWIAKMQAKTLILCPVSGLTILTILSKNRQDGQV